MAILKVRSWLVLKLVILTNDYRDNAKLCQLKFFMEKFPALKPADVTDDQIEMKFRNYQSCHRPPLRCPPKDQRSQHENHPKLKPEVGKTVIERIHSFSGRKSHYSLGAAQKLFLPEELTVAKMYCLFMQTHPPEMEVSYEKYRHIFTTQFNIGFGYPRKDTCTKCDELIEKIKYAQAENAQSLHALITEQELHQRKANTFYWRKSAAKQDSQADTTTEAVVFDFQKNLTTPNKPSNDIYFKH
ncbi:vitamin B12-dependent ribonucleotide reductase [Plakobranchus ocellatus]|uniref:Vitamin B12-dependent ribonucleotide reductase n=1 Tax=Plakobranchus ocellatus TaxID=259542 RepID=A0AAV4DR01_9GAST|nr:vitamin B12-dependent ribonucleotide reductase [Plakobranchus ocellatus]